MLLEHCERLWLLAPAEVLAEVSAEVPVLHEPQGGGPCRSRPGVFAGIVGHGTG